MTAANVRPDIELPFVNFRRRRFRLECGMAENVNTISAIYTFTPYTVRPASTIAFGTIQTVLNVDNE